jgi:hypothetical protein
MRTLLIMGCSQVKRQAEGPVPFVELYDGPIWKQARNNLPASNIAVLSAEHGFLPPLTEIEAYDRVMDEGRLVDLLNSPHERAKFKMLVAEYDEVIVLGGELYKLLSLALIAMGMSSVSKIKFACGSYLKQRAALNQYVQMWKDGCYGQS